MSKNLVSDQRVLFRTYYLLCIIEINVQDLTSVKLSMKKSISPLLLFRQPPSSKEFLTTANAANLTERFDPRDKRAGKNKLNQTNPSFSQQEASQIYRNKKSVFGHNYILLQASQLSRGTKLRKIAEREETGETKSKIRSRNQD